MAALTLKKHAPFSYLTLCNSTDSFPQEEKRTLTLVQVTARFCARVCWQRQSSSTNSAATFKSYGVCVETCLWLFVCVGFRWACSVPSLVFGAWRSDKHSHTRTCTAKAADPLYCERFVGTVSATAKLQPLQLRFDLFYSNQDVKPIQKLFFLLPPSTQDRRVSFLQLYIFEEYRREKDYSAWGVCVCAHPFRGKRYWCSFVPFYLK